MVATGMTTRSMAAANAPGSPKTASRKRKPTASGHSLAIKKNKITSQSNNDSKTNSTKPTRTTKKLEPRPKQANGRQEEMVSSTLTRRSTRIAQRLTNSDNHTTIQNQEARSRPDANESTTLKPTPIHNASILQSKNSTSSDHIIEKTLSNIKKETKKLAVSKKCTPAHQDDMGPGPSIINPQRSTAGNAKVEVTMEEYMVQINRRVKAAERRELLRGALGAPFPWSQFRRHMYTEFIRFHIAVTAGRVEDVHEALALPLNDKYWSEKVPVGPITHKDAGKYFHAMKQKTTEAV